MQAVEFEYCRGHDYLAGNGARSHDRTMGRTCLPLAAQPSAEGLVKGRRGWGAMADPLAGAIAAVRPQLGRDRYIIEDRWQPRHLSRS